MIVLDTNVISELTRPEPASAVINWLNGVTGNQIFITSVTVGELLYGVARMPMGRRKNVLTAKINELLTTYFDGQALAFTDDAAMEYADIVTRRERPAGRSSVRRTDRGHLPAQHASLATRNIRDFGETGVRLIDPWEQ